MGYLLFPDENLANKFIPPSVSHGAPIIFTEEKDSSLCLAVDCWGLNRVTKKDRYPLPTPLTNLAPTHTFTKMDLRGAYNVFRIAEGGRIEDHLRTRYGSYELLVVHPGLTKAPASFQHFMNRTIQDLMDVCVVVYLDVILIHSENPTVHTAHVLEVLRRLRANNLYAEVELRVDTTNTLDFIISPDCLKMADTKVQVVREWPQPKNVKEVQSLPASLTLFAFHRKIFG